MDSTPEPQARSVWAKPADNAPQLMHAFQDGLPVRLIATPRRKFQTCRINEPLAPLLGTYRHCFDHLPVIETSADGRERIVGLIGLVSFPEAPLPGSAVREHMRPLSEDNLIGADAGILAFVKSADQHPCRLVVSGSEITGLVSLSDLQQLPVRAALFALITHAEMTMADAIRREFNGTEGWKERLSPSRQDIIQAEYDKVAADDNMVDRLLFTQYADKITIIRKSDEFALGKNKFEAAMKAAQTLRDNLAHANDYASTREAAERVCVTVRSVEQWIEQLSSWPAVPASMRGEH